MIDINEVIYEVEFTKAMITFNPSTGEDIEPENLNEDNKITYNACVGAITLLKELKGQEAMLLKNQHKPYGISTNANSPWISRCPRCGKKVEGKQTKFCKYCGQAVKWNDKC